MILTYYGHACFKLELNGKHILIDPFISLNPKAAHIAIDEIPVDYILITHAHYDHIMDVERIAERTKAKIISNHEIVTYYESKGFSGHGMNHGGSWQFDFGKVKMLNATHSSSFPDGTYGGNPAGFLISDDSNCLYLAGDTGLHMDMKLIPLFRKPNIAILPIGGNFTMDVEEAIMASDFIECNEIIGSHYDTAEAIIIDHEKAKSDFNAKGKKLILLDIGAQWHS